MANKKNSNSNSGSKKKNQKMSGNKGGSMNSSELGSPQPMKKQKKK